MSWKDAQRRLPVDDIHVASCLCDETGKYVISDADLGCGPVELGQHGTAQLGNEALHLSLQLRERRRLTPKQIMNGLHAA